MFKVEILVFPTHSCGWGDFSGLGSRAPYGLGPERLWGRSVRNFSKKERIDIWSENRDRGFKVEMFTQGRSSDVSRFVLEISTRVRFSFVAEVAASRAV